MPAIIISLTELQIPLLYDFGLEVGDVIVDGLYASFEVISVTTLELMNGEVRKGIKVLKSQFETTFVRQQYGLLLQFSKFI